MLSKLKKAGPFIMPVLFVLALWGVFRQLQGHHWHDLLAVFRTLPIHQIWFALGVTLVSYLVMTGYDMLALRYIHHSPGAGQNSSGLFSGLCLQQQCGVFHGGRGLGSLPDLLGLGSVGHRDRPGRALLHHQPLDRLCGACRHHLCLRATGPAGQPAPAVCFGTSPGRYPGAHSFGLSGRGDVFQEGHHHQRNGGSAALPHLARSRRTVVHRHGRLAAGRHRLVHPAAGRRRDHLLSLHGHIPHCPTRRN